MRIAKFILGLLIGIWPLPIVVLLLLVARYYEDGYLFPAEGQIFNYRFLVDSQRIPVQLAFCLLPMAFMILAGWIFWRVTRKDWWSGIIGLVSFAFLFPAIGSACFSSLGLMFADFDHYDRAELDEHVFYLDSIWKVGVGHDSRALFALFECDDSGVMCRMVFSKLYYPDEEEFEAMTGQLIVDEVLDKITVQIDGIAVYGYYPK